MASAQQSGIEIVSLFVTPGPPYGGARPGRAFPVYTGFSAQPFPGALQAAFIAAGFAISDLEVGLAYAVGQGWLSLGNSINGMQEYVLEQAGFVEAGGTAPTLAASAQQLLNTCAALNPNANAIRFEANAIAGAFAVTVVSNAFAPEDLIPGYGYAVAQGWLRPSGLNLFEPVFTLTAAGAAQAE